MATKPRSTPVPLHEEERQQSTLDLVRGIANDTTTIVRKELELARLEIVEAVVARLKAAGALGGAGMFGLVALLAGVGAGAAALTYVVPVWAALLIVMGACGAVAGMAGVMGIVRMKTPPLAPKETERTIEEDVRWAKQALKR